MSEPPDSASTGTTGPAWMTRREAEALGHPADAVPGTNTDAAARIISAPSANFCAADRIVEADGELGLGPARIRPYRRARPAP